MAPNRQVNTGTKGDPVYWRIYACPGLDVLYKFLLHYALLYDLMEYSSEKDQAFRAVCVCYNLHWDNKASSIAERKGRLYKHNAQVLFERAHHSNVHGYVTDMSTIVRLCFGE